MFGFGASTNFNLNDMFGSPAGQQQRGQQAPNENTSYTTPPPASRKALANLPKVKITADDLIEESNKECLVCLQEQVLGGVAVKLPCGHLYHESCLQEWLKIHCTCPVCRYELETDDPAYESQRKAKMKKRKLRCRRDEVENMKIPKLKELLISLEINFSGCVDKRELVEKIISSGQVELTEGLPAIELTTDELGSKSVRQLKEMLLSFGISCDGMLEKSEFRQALIDSERVVIVEPTEEEGENGNDNSNSGAAVETTRGSVEEGGNVDVPGSSSHSGAGSFMGVDALGRTVHLPGVHEVPGATPTPTPASPKPNLDPCSSNISSNSSSSSSSSSGGVPPLQRHIHSFSDEEFGALGVGALKELLITVGRSCDGMMYKQELRQALLDSGEVHITSPTTPSAAPAPAPAECQASMDVDEPPEDTAPASGSSSAPLLFPVDVLLGMAIADIKQLMTMNGISVSGCVEKTDLVARIDQSGKIVLVRD